MRRPLLLSILVLAAACGAPADRAERVLLVTTTTVEDSGLLEVLVEAYHEHQGRFRVSTTALGSGAALEIGRRGDADLLITHDPAGEARLLDQGHAAEQGPLMRNAFIVVGPPDDPARIAGSRDLAEAFDRIAREGATFISRADDSGTHHRELELWRRAGRGEAAERTASYVETGSGMAETLRVADQRGGYTLTDRGTFRHLAPGLNLEALAAADPPEENVYRFTLPTRPPNPAGARDLLTWLRGPGQAVIAGYGVARFGEPLFVPADR
jgi:tungstate transport system substrate-binding protein